MGKLYVESYGWNNVKISECQNIGHMIKYVQQHNLLLFVKITEAFSHSHVLWSLKSKF